MDIMTDQKLLELVEDFLAKTKMKPSRFGLETMRDGALVTQLRAGGRSLSLKNAERVMQYMRDYQPEPDAPAQAAQAA